MTTNQELRSGHLELKMPAPPIVATMIDIQDRRMVPRSFGDENVLGEFQESHLGLKELPFLGAFVKRSVDFLGALVGVILLAPFMLIAATMIKLSSKGPIFFKQKRLTKSGRVFNMWKFRTMVVDAELIKDALVAQNEMSGPVFKMKKDPRITPVGRVLRKYSIDELPQLFNVLIGDMSLVGPRPPVYREVVKYRRWQARRLTVKTGLTCIWQVSGRNNIDFENWMRMDLQYIDQWSLWLDFKILVKTVKVVIKGDGAC
jgi:exopolysaccharide biosynthesis polyprenyl glycosylphosphotransferase